MPSFYETLKNNAEATARSAFGNDVVDAAGKWVDKAESTVTEVATVVETFVEEELGEVQEQAEQLVRDSIEVAEEGLTKAKQSILERLDPTDPVNIIQDAATAVGAGPVVNTAITVGRNLLSEQALAAVGITTVNDTEVVNLAQQCYLIYNVDAFSKFHQKLLSKNSTGGTPQPDFYRALDGDDNIQTPGYHSNSKQKIYLISTDEQAQQGFIFNKFGMKKHGDLFANITTPEVAQLVPRLRIYKVYRENGQSTDAKVEFEFAAGNNADFYTAPQDTQPFPGAPPEFVRGMDVGVESFSWRFIGDDPFMATRFVEAELKLTGQTMQAFFYQRTSSNVIPRGLALQPIPPGAPSNKYRYLDLILQPDCRRNRAASLVYQTYSPECYEVQVEVGYNGSEKNFGTFADDGQFREAIDAQTEILRLGVQEHKFDFKEDGSVGLTIKFKGFLELFAKDKSMNVLLPYGGMANDKVNIDLSGVPAGTVDKYGGKAISTNFNARGGVISLVDADELLVSLSNEKETEDIKKAKEEIESQISNVLVSSKQAFLSHILDRLETNNAVYTYIMTADEVREFSNFETNKKPGDKFPDKTSINNVVAGGGGNLLGFMIDDAAARPREASANIIRSQLSARNQEELNAIVEAGLGSSFKEGRAANLAGFNRTISYFFLGDLIAVVLDSITGEDSFDFSTGGYYFEDLFGALGAVSDLGVEAGSQILDVTGVLAPDARRNFLATDSFNESGLRNVLDQIRIILGNIEFTIKGENDSTIVNLANIPISVDSFNQFMIDNVLSKDIENYPFFEFIDDLIKALVTDFIGTKCFGGLTSAKINPQASVFHSIKELSDGLNGYYGKQLQNTIPEYNVLDPSLIDNNNPLFNTTKIHQTDKMYFVFGSVSPNESEMHGNYTVDKEAGIIHLAHGINRGLVKSMSFEKVNQEFVAEAVFASEGGTILSQLANKFDVTIEMVGNNLFRNGQYIYINAESFGGGPSYYDDGQGEDRKRSWANIMGLGGYHIITAVDNTISADGTFKTTLKARWETGGTLPPGINS
jgi:hypothetical protein